MPKTVVTRKHNTLNFPRNEHFLALDPHTYVLGGKKYWFFLNFRVLCFLVTCVLRFVLLAYYRQRISKTKN